MLFRSGIPRTHSIFYEEKKLAYFTFRTKGSLINNETVVIDVNTELPRFSLDTKDPANVLALRKDSDGIKRPIRGDTLGFVYLMDQEGLSTVDGNAYVGEFQTSDMDFSEVDPTLATRNKIFDFLSLSFTGRDISPISIEVFIDGKSVETVQVTQLKGAALDSFTLDVDTLREVVVASDRIPLHGFGKRIKLRVFTTDSSRFAVENLQVEFRLGDEGQTPQGG